MITVGAVREGDKVCFCFNVDMSVLCRDMTRRSTENKAELPSPKDLNLMSWSTDTAYTQCDDPNDLRQYLNSNHLSCTMIDEENVNFFSLHVCLCEKQLANKQEHLLQSNQHGNHDASLAYLFKVYAFHLRKIHWLQQIIWQSQCQDTSAFIESERDL